MIELTDDELAIACTAGAFVAPWLKYAFQIFIQGGSWGDDDRYTYWLDDMPYSGEVN